MIPSLVDQMRATTLRNVRVGSRAIVLITTRGRETIHFGGSREEPGESETSEECSIARGLYIQLNDLPGSEDIINGGDTVLYMEGCACQITGDPR